MAETTLESLVTELMTLEPHEIQSRIDFSIRYCPNDFLFTLCSLADSTEGQTFASTVAILDMVIIGDLSNITVRTLTRIRKPLLSCFKKHKGRDISETLARIVTMVALQIYEVSGEEWTELLQYVVRTALVSQESAVAGAQAQESAHRVRGGGVQESALRVLSCFPRALFHQLRQFHLPTFRSRILKVNSMDTELDSLLIATYVVLLDASDDSIEEEEVHLFLSNIVGSIKNLVLQENDVVHKRFELLSRIVHRRSNLFSDWHVAYVFESVVDIVQPYDVGDGIKRQALTIVHQLFNSDIQMIKGALLKVNLETRRRFVTTIMQMLEPVNNGCGGAPSKNLELGLRLLKDALIVCEESMMETILASANACYDDLEKRTAGMAAIVAISEVSHKVTIKYLDQLVTVVLSPVRDPNPQFRLAAADSIWKLCLNLGPNINKRCQDRILVALSTFIEDSNQRVQMLAAQAICDFSPYCTPNMLSPFLNVIVNQLLKLLKSRRQKVMAGAFAALNSLAICSKDRFSICFKTAMDTLIGILDARTYACERVICANCLFCISNIALAVGKERFRKHVGQVIGALRSLAACLIETDHDIKVFILEALLNFCKCLGKEFSVSETGVMPLLHELASQYAPEVDERVDDERLTWQKTLASKVMAYCTSELKEKPVISTEDALKTKSNVPAPIIQHSKPIAPIAHILQESNCDKDGLERGHAEIDMFSP